MSATNASETTDVKKVDEVTEKLEQLNVDGDRGEAETGERRARNGPRRSGRGRGNGRGRGGRRFTQERIPYEDQLIMLEEELKNKKVLETGVKGTVKWFSVMGRYGFVARADGKGDGSDDVFCHQTAIAKSPIVKIYLRTLDDNEEVVFDIVEGRKGPEAANVTGPDGKDVVGSKFARRLLHRFSNAYPPRSGNRGAARRGENNARDYDGEKEENEKDEHANDGEARSAPRRRNNRNRRDRVKKETTGNDNGADTKESATEKEEKGDGDADKKRRPRRNRNRDRHAPKKDANGQGAENSAPAETVEVSN